MKIKRHSRKLFLFLVVVVHIVIVSQVSCIVYVVLVVIIIVLQGVFHFSDIEFLCTIYLPTSYTQSYPLYFSLSLVLHILFYFTFERHVGIFAPGQTRGVACVQPLPPTPNGISVRVFFSPFLLLHPPSRHRLRSPPTSPGYFFSPLSIAIVSVACQCFFPTSDEHTRALLTTLFFSSLVPCIPYIRLSYFTPVASSTSTHSSFSDLLSNSHFNCNGDCSHGTRHRSHQGRF